MNYKWDIFIGYPGPDITSAQELYELLSKRCLVFIDCECLALGASWMKSIPEALSSSRIYIFLISSYAPKAYYLNEEIGIAIDQCREDKQKLLIPVYLNGKPDKRGDIPYGLWSIVGCDELTDGGISGISHKIIQGLDQLDIPLPEVSNEKPRKTISCSTTDSFISSRHQLAEFLMKNFTIPSLILFIEELPKGSDIIAKLPDIENDKQEFVFSVIDTMIHMDCLDQAFFDMLTNRFKLNSKKINQLKTYFIQDSHKNDSISTTTDKNNPICLKNEQESTNEHTNSLKHATFRSTLQTAINLDRTLQWMRVIQSCKEDMNTFFLLHGHSKQSLTLFLERIERFLTAEAKLPHTVYRVPFRIEHSRATSGAQWETHIRHALTSIQEKGTLAHHLYQKSQHQCLLLILGLRPLHDLDQLYLKGIEELITELLPKLLKKTRPLNAIRFLMAIDYDDQDDHTHQLIETWGLKAEETKELQYVALPEVKFPTWDEIKDYLLDLRPRPDKKNIQKVKKEFNEITTSDNLTFQYLADRLDRHIEDI